MQTCRVEILEYCSRDYDEIVNTVNVVCADNAWMSTSVFTPTPEWVDVLTNRFSKHLLLILKVDNRPVGWCRLFVDNEQKGDLGIGIIDHYRDNKLGTQLLQTAILWAKNKGIQVINLICHTNNCRAIHVFGKVGFQIDEIVNGKLLSMSRVGEAKYV